MTKLWMVACGSVLLGALLGRQLPRPVETRPQAAEPSSYVPWGFKLNLMYSGIPPRYYRNLHNCDEFDAPRVDIGMLTAALAEKPFYGHAFEEASAADQFFKARKAEIAGMTARLMASVGAVKDEQELDFDQSPAFIPPSRIIERGPRSDKKQVLFVNYSSQDDDGIGKYLGWPFLHVVVRWQVPLRDLPNSYRWYYHEYKIGRGEPERMNRRFLAGPMGIAHFGEAYSTFDFDDDDHNNPIYKEHTTYFKVGTTAKDPFEALIRRETLSKETQYGQFLVSWDGVPADRSIVASQAYYDLDDDHQSSQIDVLLTRRIRALEERLEKIERK